MEDYKLRDLRASHTLGLLFLHRDFLLFFSFVLILKLHELPCAHTKTSQITRQKRLLWARASEVSLLRTPPRITGLDVSAT
jgi:hypothetical protein